MSKITVESFDGSLCIKAFKPREKSDFMIKAAKVYKYSQMLSTNSCSWHE